MEKSLRTSLTDSNSILGIRIKRQQSMRLLKPTNLIKASKFKQSLNDMESEDSVHNLSTHDKVSHRKRIMKNDRKQESKITFAQN